MQKVTGVKINMNKIHFGKLRSPIVFYGMETPEVHLCITFFKENVIEGNLQKYKKNIAEESYRFLLTVLSRRQ